MSKPTVTSVKAELDTLTAVSQEALHRLLSRVKRLETIIVGSAGTTIVLLIGVLLSEVIHAFLLFVFLDGKLVSKRPLFQKS